MKGQDSWKPLAYASRFLTELESKYSINELEVLAVVEQFNNYVYGVELGVVLDHKAFQSVLKANKGNKTFSSRITRWVVRLLPFQVSVIHTPGRTLGMADYLSGHPSQYEGSIINAEELFNNWFTDSVVNEIVPTIYKAALAKTNEPSRAQKNCKEANVTKTEVLTIHAPLHKLNKCKQVHPSKQASKMTDESNLAFSKISRVYM